MASIKKVIEIDGEKIHLQKSQYGTKLLDYWRVVEPIKNEDGSWNWWSILFGGYRNIITVAFVTVVLTLFGLGFQEIFAGCKAMASNPCAYCNNFITP